MVFESLSIEHCAGWKISPIFFSLTSSPGQKNYLQLEKDQEGDSTHIYPSHFTQHRAWNSDAPQLPPLGSETEPGTSPSQFCPKPTSCPNYQPPRKHPAKDASPSWWQETCLAQLLGFLPFSQAGKTLFRIPCSDIWVKSNPLGLDTMIHTGLPKQPPAVF